MVGGAAAGAIHGVVAVGEMAGKAMEWRKERRKAKEEALEWDWAEVESDLDLQRKENARLRATIHSYEQAFLQLHPKSAPSSNSKLSVDRSMDIFNELKLRVASPAFLSKLESLERDGASTSKDTTLLTTTDGMYVKADVDDPNWWLWLSEKDMDKETREVDDDLGTDGYVLVSEEDIVDGIASFIARYISSIPQAKNLTPKELQLGCSISDLRPPVYYLVQNVASGYICRAMKQAFTKAESQGRLKSLWQTGKYIYTAGSWGATALSIYRHPVVIRAASMAVWTSCCLILKIIA